MKDKIKKLREQTGAGIVDCQKALKEADSYEEAVELLRKKGKEIVDKKSGRKTNEGVVEAYIHANRKVGSLLEINCETDFVAKNAQFIELAHDLAMQVAATDPAYLTEEDVPQEVINKEKEVIRDQLANEKKPKEVMEKIIEGKMKKYYSQNCLLKQTFIKDEDKTVEDLVNEAISKLGENIKINNFVRYSL